MQRRFGSEADSTLGESETRSFRQIQGGDAAKSAEDAAQEGDSFEPSFGMRLRVARGTRFRLVKRPDGKEEAVPIKDAGEQTLSAASQNPQTDKSATGITRKLFRKLFRP
jgi:hypothetical protein